MIERPMLAATAAPEKLEEIQWPVWCSPKIDGIRCLIHPELGPVTRSFKMLPNAYIYRQLLLWAGHSYLDGELVAVDALWKDLTFNQTQSAVMSRSGQPDFIYRVFDCFSHTQYDFTGRLQLAKWACKDICRREIEFLEHTDIHSLDEFAKYAGECLAAGYEGAMIRSPEGIYKSGRSTFKQGWLLKYKSWADAEGTVIGFEELHHNENVDKRDEFDLAKRSSHKANLIPAGTLGALILKTEWGKLRVGTGFDVATRQAIWNSIEVMPLGTMCVSPYLGRTVTFKYQPHGMQDLPRFPVFLRFRDSE